MTRSGLFHFGTLVLTVLTLASFTQVAHAKSDVECRIASDVKCQVSEPNGIARIVVVVKSTVGQFEVLDKRYPRCPTTKKVRYDRVLPNAEVRVTACDDPDLPDYRSFGDLRGTPFMTNPFLVDAVDSNGDGELDTVNTSPIQTDTIGIEEIKAGVIVTCPTANSCNRFAAFCDAEGGVGTCYDDHCECDIPDPE